MFRLRNQNDKECAISKGSEFRTPISLANSGVYLERRLQSKFSSSQMNEILKESNEYAVMLHIRHSPASETFNTEKNYT